MSALVLLPDVPCLDCLGRGWVRSCPDCFVDAGFSRVACKTHRQRCAKHLVGEVAEHEPPQDGPRAAEPEAKLTAEEIMEQFRRDHPPAPSLVIRWQANAVRGEISYRQGLGGSPGCYGTSVHLRQTGKRLSYSAIEHTADTTQALIELIRSRYSDYREVKSEVPLQRWLTRAEDGVKRPTRQKKDVDILAKTTPKKAGRPRKNRTEVERAAYEADIKRRVEQGRAVALASSAERREQHPPCPTPGGRRGVYSWNKKQQENL